MNEWLTLILGGMFTLILGNYVFTWQIYRLCHKMETNHIQHLADRITALERHTDGS